MNSSSIRENLIQSIGNTPLIRLRRASEETGCTILGKAEFMNPGGSVKDRAAKAIVLDAEKQGVLKPGGLIVEGTAGNTGIGLALVGNSRGYRTLRNSIRTILRVPSGQISSTMWPTVRHITKPQALKSGSRRREKSMPSSVRWVPVEPWPAPGLFSRKRILRFRLDWQIRWVPHFFPIILRVSSVPGEIPVCFQLLQEEGLCLGGSSGINVAGAIRLAKELGPGKTIVTILCDSGTRYQSKLFNPQFLKKKGLPIPEWLS